ncbi:MAG TPA: ABC transporter permease [Acidimicrobiales bacterium]|nr:ABC transporter permease [Acidimicrobiales bacterium]
MAVVADRSDLVAGRAAGQRRLPPPTVLASFAAVLLIVLLAVIPGPIEPYDPLSQNLFLSSAGPSHLHWLGTDSNGRDVLSLVISGTRSAVLGPALIALGTVLLGATLGMAAGLKGGAFDAFVNRFADLLYALPGLLVVIVVVGIAGGGYWLAVLVLLVLSIPGEIRLCRGASAVQARLAYVDAARTLGLSTWRIMFVYLAPNILPTIIATLLLDFVGALLGLAGLAYLGFGTLPGTPSWGQLLYEGQSLLQQNPWMSVAPSILIILTATSVTLIGDWFYDRTLGLGGTR